MVYHRRKSPKNNSLVDHFFMDINVGFLYPSLFLEALSFCSLWFMRENLA